MNVEQRQLVEEVTAEIVAKINEIYDEQHATRHHYAATERDTLRRNLDVLIDHTHDKCVENRENYGAFEQGMYAAYAEMNAKLVVARFGALGEIDEKEAV